MVPGGHTLRLTLSTEDTPYLRATANPFAVAVFAGSTIDLPLGTSLFPTPSSPPPPPPPTHGHGGGGGHVAAAAVAPSVGVVAPVGDGRISPSQAAVSRTSRSAATASSLTATAAREPVMLITGALLGLAALAAAASARRRHRRSTA
jgi:hypothetical protein